MSPPSQSSIEALHTITLYIYIYRREMNPPSQLSTDALHTAILTARSSTMHIDRIQMNPPGQSIIDALNTATLHIYIYKGDEPPRSTDHRCLEYCYTAYIYREEGDEPPDQSIIDALHTTTLLIYIEGR